MNFDFLKELTGLNKIYENCTNAEKLAMSIPDQSIIASRKSAEILARFIYMEVYSNKMEKMDFAGILSDPEVCSYIHNNNVINAFHFIRKNGNLAVHESKDETIEDAVDVLEKLHYVTGECACILGLIKKYLPFDDNIEYFKNVQLIDTQDAVRLAKEMAFEYSKKYNAQFERDCYYQNQIDNLMEEFNSLLSQFKLVPGNVDSNEVLEFKDKPLNVNSLKPIQNYYIFLALSALKQMLIEQDDNKRNETFSYNAELTVYGENGYKTSDVFEFIMGIRYDILTADGFKIVSNYSGPSVSPVFNINRAYRKKEFYEEIPEIGKTEKFVYNHFEFLYNYGEGFVEKLDSLDKDLDWYSWNMEIDIKFDFNKYPDITNQLHNVVRKTLPDDVAESCLDVWYDGELGRVCSGQWCISKLRDAQDYFDEVNLIINPIINECKIAIDGKWFCTEYPFGVAAVNWTDDGFKITGAVL